MYTYPAGDLDRPENLLALLGSFWARTYAGNDLVASLLYARARFEVAALDDLQDLVKSVSRQTVPVYDVERWDMLVLKESERGSGVAGLLFDGSQRFDLNPNVFGGTTNNFAFPVPDGLVGLPLICNRFAAPSLVLCEGIDHTVQQQTLTFRADPFLDPLVPIREVWRDGKVVDREAVLWMFRPAYDRSRVYRMFGYATEIRSMSQGRGSFTMEFDHYEPTPNNVAQLIIEGKKR